MADKIFGDAKVEYPREWEFCLFGKDKERLRKAINECVIERISHKDSKSNGKYCTQKVKVYVESEKARNELYEKFKNHPEINYIL